MLDPLAVVEVAYCIDTPPPAWLEQVGVAIQHALGGTQGVLAVSYDASRPDWVQPLDVAFKDIPQQFAHDFLNHDASVDDRRVMVKIFRSTPFGTVLTGGLPPSLCDPYQSLLQRHGFADVVAVNATDPTGRGSMILVPATPKAYAPTTGRLWERIAAHVSAGARVRRTLQPLLGTDPTEQAEAVLGPDGRIEHAVGVAKTAKARDSLREALARRTAALSRPLQPEGALELWTALVAGRWSIVEHFERDGKRYFVAIRNDPRLIVDRALTEREQQVLGYAELGHSNKLIAYSLGLAMSTVSTLLTRARRKIGIRAET